MLREENSCFMYKHTIQWTIQFIRLISYKRDVLTWIVYTTG